MPTGTLQVSVMDGSIAQPVPGATVRVIGADGSVQTATTDSSGMAPVFTLSAPDESLSETPNPPSPPFSLYTVEVTKPGYNTTTIQNVRIFPGQLAMQDVNLLTTTQNNGRASNIVLPANEVGDPPNKPFEAPLKDTTRVLSNVTIPEYIVVHNGSVANTAASNYVVPFKDYIKNVASNEIYSTWKPASLCANILAIISFTLNRVYTEWYPSLGYQYTITSDINTDQMFVPNSTIYKSISDTVDDIFTNYIQKNNFQQPYLAQYRANTSTPGILSQWGTQSLAQQGYDCNGILRYYYGSDIHLNTAPVVEGLPSSYPGSVMRQGDCSQAIQQFQNYLNVIRKNYPAIPAITNPNGYFDAQTLAAVQAFQKIAKISQDGIVGKTTWYEISRYYTAIAGLQASSGQNPTPAELAGRGVVVTPTPEAMQMPELKFGSTGDAVMQLQSQLKELGYYRGEIDGKFGQQTQSAVRAFQIANGVAADGIVGPVTWTLLQGSWAPLASCATTPPETTPPTPPSGSFQYTVVPGDTLYLLAQRFGTTVDAIKALNGLTSDNLNVGQVLNIPYPESTTPPVTPPPSGSFNYTVVAGDSLYLIAQRFGTTVDAIKALNGLTSNTLYIGQVLKIPSGAAVTPPPSNYFNYTVVSGDTLYLLAQRFGTTVDAIKALNGLTSNNLSVGQVLKIPTSAPTGTRYVVAAGDTLYLLAQRFGTTVDAIRAKNGLTSDALSIGQVLYI